MEVSLFAKITLAGIVAVAFLYCVFGYSFARFLLPVSGVLIIEAAMFLFAVNPFLGNELATALFYGGVAVAGYIVLFFVLRLAGFFTGVIGAALFSAYVVIAFGLADMAYIYSICITLCFVIGGFSAVYKRAGVIVASSLLGGCVAAGILAFLFLATSINIGAGESIAVGMMRLVKENAILFLGASTAFAVIGIIVQLRLTGRSQALEKKAIIYLKNQKAV